MRGKRRMIAALGLAVLGVAPLLAVAAPAGAQDPEYPPGTCRLSLNASVAERGCFLMNRLSSVARRAANRARSIMRTI